MSLRTAVAVLALIAAGVASSARAGVALDFQSGTTDGKVADRGTLLLSANAIRMESPDAVVIWRADDQVAWILDVKANTYHEITREGLAGMADAMKQAQAAMAQLPPEQRAMAEKMMAGRMSASRPTTVPLSVKKAEGADTAAGLACSLYDMFRGDQPAGRACVTSWSALPVTRTDLQVLVDFSAFMREAMSSVAGSMPSFLPALEAQSGGEALPGVPLKTWSADGRHLSEITRLAREEAPAAKFRLPEGARKSSLR